jgi:hypothetical protein
LTKVILIILLGDLNAYTYKNNNLTLYIVSSSTDTDDIMQAQSHDLVKNIFSKPLSINSVKHILQS